MLSLTLIILAVTPPTDSRIPIACSVTAEQRALEPSDSDVTALVCSERPGFWVPRARYLELREADDLRAEVALLASQVEALRTQREHLTASSSIAVEQIAALENVIQRRDLACTAEMNVCLAQVRQMQPGIVDHPLFRLAEVAGTAALSIWVTRQVFDKCE